MKIYSCNYYRKNVANGFYSSTNSLFFPLISYILRTFCGIFSGKSYFENIWNVRKNDKKIKNCWKYRNHFLLCSIKNPEKNEWIWFWDKSLNILILLINLFRVIFFCWNHYRVISVKNISYDYFDWKSLKSNISLTHLIKFY